jgi:hypothetical protein
VLPPRLGLALWALRTSFGTLAIASGLGRAHLASTPDRLAACLELGAGVLVFTPFTAAAASFLTGWLLLLALVSLLAGGPGDRAASDLVLAAGAFTLARLTRVNESSLAG